MAPDDGMTVLDNPAYAALTGPQADLAEVRGRVARYVAGVARFAGLPDEPTARDWFDLAELVGADDAVALLEPPARPGGWSELRSFPAVQMVRSGAPSDGAGETAGGQRTRAGAAVGLDLVELGPDDVPEMLDLVARTEPGPFGPRTVELGRYVGVRDGSRLAAMAGERMRAPGWTEVSAVCTDPAYRGRGLGALLVEDVASGIEARGDRAFLQVMAANTGAQSVYAARGFTIRRSLTIRVLRPASGR